MHYAEWPFSVEELASPGADVDSLFRRLFKTPPPDFPRHFVVRFRSESGSRLAAYMHFTAQEPGVYLLGGLGVDTRVYRLVQPGVRHRLAEEGSLSRWFLHEAIAALGSKRAVFAYTGDIRSRRDAHAIGMVDARPPYLFVQWHEEPQATRSALVERIAALGPF